VIVANERSAKSRVWPELPSATSFNSMFGVDRDAPGVYAIFF